MFDPNLPAPNSRIRSAELRDQFNGLKELIDAVPAGTPVRKAFKDQPVPLGLVHRWAD